MLNMRISLSLKNLILICFIVVSAGFVSYKSVNAATTCCDTSCCASYQVDGHCDYTRCCNGTCTDGVVCSYNPGDYYYENCSGMKCDAAHPAATPCGGGGCTPGATSCGACQCPGGTKTCSDGCTTTTQSCSCCTVSTPRAAQQVYPTNGATDIDNDVTLRWNPTTSWGEGCPIRPSYSIFYRPKGTSCVGGTYMGANIGTNTSYTLNNLPWNTTYCWMVRTSNGASIADSPKWEFTTAETPQHLGTNVIAPNCGSGLSGNAGIAGTDNPVIITSVYKLNPGVEGIAQIAMAFIPNNIINADNITEAAAQTNGKDYFMGLVSIDHNNPSNSAFYLVNNSSTYSGPYKTGSIASANGRTTLMDINSGTRVEIVDSQTVRIIWKLRFEDSYPYIPVNNIYSGAFHLSPYAAWTNGFWNSDPGIIGLDRAMAKRGTWGVNTQVPTVTVNGPEATSATDFGITWGASGHNLTQAEGYMWTTNQPMSITKVSPIPTTNYGLTTAEPVNYSPSNIGVNLSTLGRHIYKINSGVDPTEIINTKMAVNDTACNRVVVQGTDLPLSESWFLTARGDVFATNVDVNILGVDLNPPIQSLNSSYSYLSTYISGVREDHLSTITRASKNDFILEAYDDLNDTPPISTGYTDWYSYLYDLVTKNVGSTTIKEIPATTVAANSNLNTVFSVSPYVKQHVKINGNLVLNQNVTCNLQSIIFVDGNLTISPHFAVEESGALEKMGCMFVVRGDTIVLSGIDANTNPINYPTSSVLGASTRDGTVKAAGTGVCGSACTSSNDCIEYGTGGDKVECINGTCSNVLCPNNDEQGTICNCLGVATCGQYCGYGGVGLCGDGISVCRYLNYLLCPYGTQQTVCFPSARENPSSSFYDPAFDAAWDEPRCTARDQGNSGIRNNASPNRPPTQAQVAALCQWCGNNKLDPGEECDPPGANVNGQLCQSDCTLRPIEVCGDGLKNQPSEQCDYAETISSCSTNYSCNTSCQCTYNPPEPITGEVHYDFIQAFIISNGSYTTSVDNRGNPANGKYDGLYVLGSVIANSASLGRDLRLFNNAKQPAELIEFDTRYSQVFKDDLARYSYSIREKGYLDRLQD